MQLSLILLKKGEYLISQVDELDYEPRVHMHQPYLIGGKAKVILTPWPSFTTDKDILLDSSSLLTMCDPSEDLKEKYLKKVGKTMEDIQPTDDRVLLTEDESVPEAGPGPLPDDDYEPEYVEESLY